MSDKVSKLVKKLWHQASGWDLDVPEDRAELERIIRAELEPLLDAAEDSFKKFLAHHNSESSGGYNDMGDALMKLRAELQGWTARTPDGR